MYQYSQIFSFFFSVAFPEISGRISYEDSIDFKDGCTIDIQREFSVTDRVENKHTEVQSIHSCPMEFRPVPDSDTYFDQTSLLPTFVYDVDTTEERQFFKDVRYILSFVGLWIRILYVTSNIIHS